MSIDLSSAAWRARIVADITTIAADAWDRCARDTALSTGSAGANPFVSHRFLSSLEESGAVSAETGWQPAHVILCDDQEQIIACMPCYAKSHSWGEYVFDQAWADALEGAGGRYYPKFLTAVPFTPVSGPRLLVRGDVDATAARRMLMAMAHRLCQNAGASSWHVTFAPEPQIEVLAAQNMLIRKAYQFYWFNQNYCGYDEFLNDLRSRKRKLIRRERRDAQHGVNVEWLTGSDILEKHWDVFFRFYQDTGARKWGRPYLNRAFFSLLGTRMADQLLLILARQGADYVAGALNFIGPDALYGRYWGCVVDHPFLHFELCYHQAIEYAIAHRLDRVEAGAQGFHKLARGYRPVATYSAHHIRHPSLASAVSRYLSEEDKLLTSEMAALTSHSPYRLP